MDLGDKKKLRAELLARRRALPEAQVAAWSAAIAEHLWRMPEFIDATAILTYVSSKDNEPDTQGIIRRAIADGRKVLVPVCRPQRRLEWSMLEDLEDLAVTRYGVLEPREDCLQLEPVPEGSVCLVPGLGFTGSGHRIGYAGGFYDRFLAGYGGLSAGITFGTQLIPTFKIENHDIPVQWVVTEQGAKRAQILINREG